MLDILNLGKLLNLVTTEIKMEMRKLERLHKSPITNAYRIVLIVLYSTCINEWHNPIFTVNIIDKFLAGDAGPQLGPSYLPKIPYHSDFCMAIGNVELMHVHFPKYLHIGTARMK